MGCRRLIVTALMLTSASGCALFGWQAGDGPASDLPFVRSAAKPDADENRLTRKVVRLDAAVVVQPASDQGPLKLVWEGLDEISPTDHRDRQRLNRNGFRVGVSGMTLPWAVASLLDEYQTPGQPPGSSADFSGSQSPTKRRSDRFGTPLMIPEGSSSQLLLRTDVDGAEIPEPALSGQQQLRDYQNGRCLLQVDCVEYGDGWVVLKLLPEIHFGANTTRYSIEQGREQLSVRQRVKPLYEQQFEVKLHVGEAMVVGYQELPDWTFGRLFFQSHSLTSTRESLLVLRLTDVEEVVGQKNLTVHYSKH